MLFNKYKPKTIKELVGNESKARKLIEFVKSWKKGQFIVLTGPPGSGKNAVVEVAGKELGMSVVYIEDVDMNEIKQHSILGKKIFIIEDPTKRDLEKLVKESFFPVIVISDNPYEKRYHTINGFQVLKFEKIRSDSITKFILHIAEKEGHKISDYMAKKIARFSGGDLRAALLDLEVLLNSGEDAIGYRDTDDYIFDNLRIIFKTKSIQNIKSIEMDAQEMFKWLEWNIESEYKQKEIANAFIQLADADIVSSRIIKRQGWSLQKYFSDYVLCGVALAKQKPKYGFVKYKRPEFLKKDPTVYTLSSMFNIPKSRIFQCLPLLSHLKLNSQNP